MEDEWLPRRSPFATRLRRLDCASWAASAEGPALISTNSVWRPVPEAVGDRLAHGSRWENDGTVVSTDVGRPAACQRGWLSKGSPEPGSNVVPRLYCAIP